jgi:solute carrier family 25 protein 44
MALHQQSHQHAEDVRLPADVDWNMLDKSKFLVLGAALFSGVSATQYPAVVLKTRQQVMAMNQSCTSLGLSLLKTHGLPGLYKGFTTSLMGTIPARAIYMSTLEFTKCNVSTLAKSIGGMSEPGAAAVANAAAGLTASFAAQFVWTPIDVISQRLMVQGGRGGLSTADKGGIDAFRTILKQDGPRGLYRGFGLSVVTCAPSNALWWASYCVIQRSLWTTVRNQLNGGENFEPSSVMLVGVQGFSASLASGVSAVLTTPLDTLKTRLQVLKDESGGRPTLRQTLNTLVTEGGWMGFYRGIGPRWASMSMSATTMIITYEFLKRMSTKPEV